MTTRPYDTSQITDRQWRCLLALLEIEERADDGKAVHRNAGTVARAIGFQHGPIQHGNGAKSGRSFSGTGAMGKWTGPALRGLVARGLAFSRYERDARIASYWLTSLGRACAEDLRDRGVSATDPDAANAKAYGAP